MGSSTAEYQAMISKYASVGGLAVLTWDILSNIPEDYRILFAKQKRKFSIPTVIYIVARLGAFAYALISVIFATAPIGHCRLVNAIALAFCPVSFGATCLLFFLRLRAVYNGNRLVLTIFSILWIAVVAGSAMDPLAIKGAPLVLPGEIDTGYCTDVEANHDLSVYGAVAPIIYDTLIWLAISWRISRISDEPHASIVTAMVFGTNLPSFTKSLLRDGQIYYFITVVTGVVWMVLFFSPGVPEPLSDLFEDFYPVVVNIMACLLFRRTKSGAIRDYEVSHSTMTHRTRPAIEITISTGSYSETESKEAVLAV